jgi:hypothetical protein
MSPEDELQGDQTTRELGIVACAVAMSSIRVLPVFSITPLTVDCASELVGFVFVLPL